MTQSLPLHVTRLLAALLALTTLLVVAGPAAPARAADVDLAALRNNVGIAHDPFSAADFDGSRYSYSALALRLEGLAGGETVEAGGMTYTWPDVASGEPDNVGARGQTIPIDSAAGATRLGFLGAATNGPITDDFELNYVYPDAEGQLQTATVSVRLTFSDWTLNAGSSSPSFNNVIAATTPFRLLDSVQPELVDTHVFATSVVLNPEMTLTSITLPDTSGKIHLFAMSVG